MPEGFNGGAKPTILVVEDEAALLALLRYNLERQGFHVEEATDGQEALLRIAEAKPDLVLLDWMLPAMSGIDHDERATLWPQNAGLRCAANDRIERNGDAIPAARWFGLCGYWTFAGFRQTLKGRVHRRQPIGWIRGARC